MFKTSLMTATFAAMLCTASAGAHEAHVIDNGSNDRIAIAQKGSACVSYVNVHVDGRDVRVKVDVKCNGVTDLTSLKHRAAAATASYYALHAVTDGTISEDLEEIYAPTLDRAGMPVTREDHLADLANYAARYNRLSFNLVEESLDLSACTAVTHCAVRGTVETTSQSLAGEVIRHGQADFVLVFDLRGGRRQVIGECSVTTSVASYARGCTAYPFE